MTHNPPLSPQASLPFKLFGWILGSLSILNLVRDLASLELYGLLRDWIDAYSLFVRTVGGFLFGWIDWSWISVDSNEMHVLILAAILAGTLARASLASEIARGKAPEPIATLVGVSIGVMLCFLALVILAPTPWGAWTGFGFVAILFIGSSLTDDEEMSRAQDFRRELLVVLCGFVLILLANFLIFRPG